MTNLYCTKWRRLADKVLVSRNVFISNLKESCINETHCPGWFLITHTLAVITRGRNNLAECIRRRRGSKRTKAHHWHDIEISYILLVDRRNRPKSAKEVANLEMIRSNDGWTMNQHTGQADHKILRSLTNRFISSKSAFPKTRRYTRKNIFSMNTERITKFEIDCKIWHISNTVEKTHGGNAYGGGNMNLARSPCKWLY